MITDANAIRTYFAKLGLEPEVADIYLALHVHGPQTISELSRNARVERTRIYRLIDHLLESNLIEMESHYKRGIIRAAPIANLTILITQKEQELKGLQDELSLIEKVLGRNSLSNPATRVQFYHGPSGYKQMLWNETKAKSEVLAILYQNMQVKTDAKFYERWATESKKNNVHYRSIGGKNFIRSEKEWYGSAPRKRRGFVEVRYLEDSVFTITHSVDIYDNVVAYYNWKDGEVFGIEIYNHDIADTQRQLFEMLWAQAKPENNL